VSPPLEREARPAPTWRWAALVVLAFALVHGPSLAARYRPHSWLFADGAFYFATVRAVADHGRLEQRALHPESWYAQDLGWNRRLTDDWSNVALGRDGGWYPKHPILLPLLAVVPYKLYGPQGTLVANVLLNLAFVLLTFLLGRRVAHPAAAALVAAGVACVPFVVDMSYTFSNDLLGAVLLLGAVELALARRFGLAGVLAGLAVWSRVTNVAFLPAVALAGWSAGGWRGVARAAAFALVPLSAYALLNTVLFGAPWVTSYHRVIVREDGVMKTAAHTRLFNVEFARGLARIVTGADGAFRSFPLLAPGLAGALALGWRRRALGASVLLFALLPMLAYAKYDWYRPHFLYPSYGASALGLAGAIGLVFPARVDGERRLAWRWVAGALGFAMVAAIPLLRSPEADPARLSSHLREARVFLDDVPCDYFNVQNERWECSKHDPSGWAMTGLVRSETVTVRGVRWDGLWMHPSPSGRWRRIVWDALDAARVELTFALADPTQPGPVEVEVRARGQEPVAITLSGPGDERRITVAIPAGEGPALEVRTRAGAPHWKQLVFEGLLGR
jgi:hypothetical protein